MKINKLYKGKKKFAIGGDIYEDPKTAIGTGQKNTMQGNEKVANTTGVVSNGLSSLGPWGAAIGAGVNSGKSLVDSSNDEFGNTKQDTGSYAKNLAGNTLSADKWLGEANSGDWKAALGDITMVKSFMGDQGFSDVFGKTNADKNREETLAKRAVLEKQKYLRNQNLAGSAIQQDATNRGFTTGGQYDKQFYGEKGGTILKQGGKLKPISDDTFLAIGNSHKQGGIQLSNNAEIEGNETLKDKGDSFMVMSNKLKNPNSGNTFAKDDLKLAKQIDQLEDKRENLENTQQRMNGDNSSNPYEMKMGKGGKLNKSTKNWNPEIKFMDNPYPKEEPEKYSKKEQLEGDAISKVLMGRNQKLNFVDRAYNSQNYPSKQTNTIKGFENVDPNEYSTHLMSIGESQNGKTPFFPTLEYNKNTDQLDDTYGKQPKESINAPDMYVNYISEKGYKTATGLGIRPNDARQSLSGLEKEKSIPMETYRKGGKISKMYDLGGIIHNTSKGRTYIGGSGKRYNLTNDGQRFVQEQGSNNWSPVNGTFQPDVEKQFNSQPTPNISNQRSQFDVQAPEQIIEDQSNNNETSNAPNNVNFRSTSFGNYNSTGDLASSLGDGRTSLSQPNITQESSNGSKLKSSLSRLGQSPTFNRGIRQLGNAAIPLGDYISETKSIKDLENTGIPDPILRKQVMLNKVNMDVDRADVNRTLANQNQYIDRGLSDSNVSASTKAGLFAQGIEAKQGINQAERNANLQIANQQTGMNSGIDAENNQVMNARNQAEMQKKIDIINSKRDRNSKLAQSFRDNQNTGRQEEQAQTQSGIDLARLDPQARDWFNNTYMKKAGYKNYGRNFNGSYSKGGRLSKMFC